ncbi:hypothetical protein AB0D13_02835 [Streptomyces sp. NPDC048430]|uniref:hypothetical protein n=1 Tax=Streptomyces sp. NPDC048430 TaxID=3155388 RepID=UPI00343FA067
MATVTLTPEEIDLLDPTFIGPTWQQDAFGRWVLPGKTLGWQIAGWSAEYLRSEDGGPWKFTREQLRFVLHWYAVDENGRFTNRKGVLQRMKGWGKDPLLAVLCLVELCGPSRFSHWDEAGEPVGVPHPRAWVQVTAVNQSQTTNTMALIPSLMSDAFKAKYGIKDGAVLIRANGGKCRLEAVTSSFRALEGKRTTFLPCSTRRITGCSATTGTRCTRRSTVTRPSRTVAISRSRTLTCPVKTPWPSGCASPSTRSLRAGRSASASCTTRSRLTRRRP